VARYAELDSRWSTCLRLSSKPPNKQFGLKNIKELMQDCKDRLKSEHPKIYSHELLNNLFSHPYTKIELVQNDLGASRITAMKYLNELSKSGIVEKNKVGKHNYYVNRPLHDLFLNIPNKPF